MSDHDISQDSSLIGQRQFRIEKIQKFREMGIDPFPSVARKTHQNIDVLENFEELENHAVTVIGRLESFREHGQLVFGEIRDQSATIQLYIRADELQPTSKEEQSIGFEDLNLLDIGDFVIAEGIVTKTQRGEISVMPKLIKIAAKSVRPIPRKIDDKEDRFRRRYVDMNVNPEVRKIFERRSRFWQAHRDFLNSKGFFEVNIPVLEHVPGGGDAVPFTTHMNAIHEDFFLRISHELPLKRLIGGGFDKVYDIGARFRNEGLSDEHLPEHVAMEFYWAYANWEDGMDLIQDLFNYVIKETYGGRTKFNIRGFEVDFSGEWERIDFNEIMNKHFEIGDVYNVDLDTVKTLLKENNIEFDENTINIPRGVDSLWKQIRKTIVGPAFLVNHPKYLSPLQKPSTDNPQIVERCQPIIAGSELGNGWSELNDPIEQYERFVEQQKMRDAGDDEAQWLDIDYVEMLEYGMPPTFGWGHSERVFWFLEDITAREGVPFPQLKFHIDESTKKIYSEINFDTLREVETNETSKSQTNIKFENVDLPEVSEMIYKLEENVDNDYHLLHARMIAAGMRAYAEKYGANPKLWYLTGLLHDIDYTKFPELHPHKSIEWFSEWGLPKELSQAVLAHDYRNTEAVPKSPLDQALVAVDEISGLLYAYAQMRPEKFDGMQVKSAIKRFKDKKFAPNLDRKEILEDIEFLGVELEDHVELLIKTFSQMKEFGGEVDYADFSDFVEPVSSENEFSEANQDFENRIAIVVNRELENWQIANAVGHISAYLGNQLEKKFGTGENFVTKDGKNHPRNSQYPIVILSAKPGQMTNFMEKVRESGLLYHGFIREMIDTTNDQEIVDILANKDDSELEYLGVGVFGDNETLKKLTNKFKLWG